MTTTKQKQKVRDGNRAFVVSLGALIISAASLAWQVYQSHTQKRSYEKQFGSIETSIRMLTAAVAPQYQKAIDDSLQSLIYSDTSLPNSTFALIESRTEQLRQLHAKLPNEAVALTSENLGKAISRYPDSLPAWRAAAQMISYRSELRIQPAEKPSCFLIQGRGGQEAYVDKVHDSFYQDCTLDLDDTKTFDAVALHFHDLTSGANGIVSPRIFLRNGIVKYSGGPMIKIAGLTCVNCAFELTPPIGVPPATGRTLAQQLLTADLNDAMVNVPIPKT